MKTFFLRILEQHIDGCDINETKKKNHDKLSLFSARDHMYVVIALTKASQRVLQLFHMQTWHFSEFVAFNYSALWDQAYFLFYLSLCLLVLHKRQNKDDGNCIFIIFEHSLSLCCKFLKISKVFTYRCECDKIYANPHLVRLKTFEKLYSY